MGGKECEGGDGNVGVPPTYMRTQHTHTCFVEKMNSFHVLWFSVSSSLLHNAWGCVWWRGTKEKTRVDKGHAKQRRRRQQEQQRRIRRLEHGTREYELLFGKRPKGTLSFVTMQNRKK